MNINCDITAVFRLLFGSEAMDSLLVRQRQVL